MSCPWMNELYTPFDFTSIASQPHFMHKGLTGKLPHFTSDNVISAKDHLKTFKVYMEYNEIDQLDISLKCFVLSLKKRLGLGLKVSMLLKLQLFLLLKFHF